MFKRLRWKKPVKTNKYEDKYFNVEENLTL